MRERSQCETPGTGCHVFMQIPVQLVTMQHISNLCMYVYLHSGLKGLKRICTKLFALESYSPCFILFLKITFIGRTSEFEPEGREFFLEGAEVVKNEKNNEDYQFDSLILERKADN